MGTINYEEYRKEIFKPIISLTGFADSFSRLKTERVPDLAEQASKLASIKFDGEGYIQLHNQGFIVRVVCEDVTYLAVSIDSMKDTSRELVGDLLDADGLDKADFEPCFFLYFCRYLQGLYSVKKELSKDAIIDALGLGVREYDSKYTGHGIEEIQEIYDEVIIYKIPEDSVYLSKSLWYLAAKLSANIPEFRSKIVSDGIIGAAQRLLDLENINAENIYLALTAVHWKHCYLEIYRCIEGIYYLPWMLDLKKQTQLACPAVELAKMCRKSVKWREREEESIRKIFIDVPDALISSFNLSKLPVMVGIVVDEKEESKSALGRRIYKIRNQSVHQEDYEETDYTEVSKDCWPVITELLFLVVNHIYSTYPNDISLAQKC